MLYPKITRYNFRKRGPVESRKKISQRNSIKNAIQELKVNFNLLEEEMYNIKSIYGTEDRVIGSNDISNTERKLDIK